MTVSSFIENIKNTELNQINAKLNDDTIIQYINLGLIDISTQFEICEKEILIDLQENKTFYDLPEDCLFVETVYDENGDYYNLNDENDALSILTPEPRKIQVPNPANTATISVIYRAVVGQVSELTDEIPLTLQYIEPLSMFVAYKAYLTVNASTQAQDNIYYIRYVSKLNELIKRGICNHDRQPINPNYLRKLV